MMLYTHQGQRLNFAFLCFPPMVEGVPNSHTAVLLLRRVRKGQSLWNKFLLISCKGLKCVPFMSTFLRLWRIHGKGKISLEILLLWLLSHCLFCWSALTLLPHSLSLLLVSLNAPYSACGLPLLPHLAPYPLLHFLSDTALHSLSFPPWVSLAFCHNTPPLQGDTYSSVIML